MSQKQPSFAGASASDGFGGQAGTIDSLRGSNVRSHQSNRWALEEPRQWQTTRPRWLEWPPRWGVETGQQSLHRGRVMRVFIPWSQLTARCTFLTFFFVAIVWPFYFVKNGWLIVKNWQFLTLFCSSLNILMLVLNTLTLVVEHPGTCLIGSESLTNTRQVAFSRKPGKF